LAGFSFDHWEGDLSGADNPAQIVMSESESVTAVFVAAPRYNLVVNIATPDSGTVTLSLPQPEGGYLAGDNVSLTANAATGYVFSHWEGSLEGSANPYELLISENQSVTAVFYPTVQVISGPSNGGTVNLEPAEPSNGYTPGTQVTISAVPAEGYVFNGWTGDASGLENPLTITVDGPKSLTANFLAQTSFPWRWTIIGIVGFLMVVLLAYFVRSELSKG
jgi:autotransporter family porin